jgi:predicted HicB family RNase H-like nuclease
MNTQQPMTPDEEYEFYSREENQQPQGAAVRRRPSLSEMVPVRFTPDLLAQVRQRAQADDRSVASWVRRAVERELRRSA